MARLVFSGLFERHPDIKIITHHMEAMIPYLEGRIGLGWSDQLGRRAAGEDYRDLLPRRPLDYFRRFYADTALSGSAVHPRDHPGHRRPRRHRCRPRADLPPQHPAPDAAAGLTVPAVESPTGRTRARPPSSLLVGGGLARRFVTLTSPSPLVGVTVAPGPAARRRLSSGSRRG
ncbi:hypothetical protein AB0J35_29815 [Nonomuraea angiospora]|uniref:hypothetical protein n=1 Tax=Nonomuraea angiospora TaxID=46172 RepID=UPI0034183018